MSFPVVSIIGRPNVGKSTLFNRLVGSRVAITEDSPGVTRDRLYREVNWLNRKFLLMDTGGLFPGSEDAFAKEIEFQVDLAVQSSDLVLFIVDGKDGVTNLDRMIADKLITTGRDCLLVVNKIDSHKTPDSIFEFYELGFGDMMVVSAEQSFGLGDLLDKILERLPEKDDMASYEDALKICLIGKPNVGKSSLVNKLLGEDRMIVTDIPGTTRDAIDSPYRRNGRDYIIIDTAGLRKNTAIDSRVEKYSTLRTIASVERADLCLFMIDATMGVTEQDTKIAGHAHNNNKASIIVVNKWDLVEKDTNTMKEYADNIRNKMSFMPYAPIIFISVKTGYHVEDLFDTIQKVDENYSFRVSTSLLNKLVRDSVMMSPPPTDKGERLKIFYASQVSARPAKFLLYCNDKKLFHFSYIRYLENQIRKNFDFTGVPIILKAREREDES